VRRILFIGDVVGRPGRSFLIEQIARLKEENGVDIAIANGENAAAGAGITGKIARELLEAGIDGITLGDHVWDQKAFPGEIGGIPGICRPANLPEACPGPKFIIVEKEGFRLGVFTVLGRTFMPPRDCPFAEADRVLRSLEGQVDAVVAEIHAEATSEKQGFGWYLDGRVAAVVGTHTHVPTADAGLLRKGTAYITDLGMTGPYESVLGRQVEPVVAKFLDGMPRRFEMAERDIRISGVLIDLDESTGLAADIRLLTIRKEETTETAAAGVE
jgi:2',3'-cyclic-nucleotide 2'-phosphodiesterase